MPQDYLERHALLNADCALWRKAEVALADSASRILTEDSNTPNHANRVKLANRVFENVKNVLKPMQLRLLTIDSIADNGNSTSDSDMQLAIDSLIDEYALGELGV